MASTLHVRGPGMQVSYPGRLHPHVPRRGLRSTIIHKMTRSTQQITFKMKRAGKTSQSLDALLAACGNGGLTKFVSRDFRSTVAQSSSPGFCRVLVKGRPVTKAGASIASDAEIRLTADDPKFVCRAGLKLEKALDHFAVDVTGKVVMDAGLSTGGFCDCLLQRGAAVVYGVDVGYGQVSEKIRVDPRVVVMERTNLRHLRQLPPGPDGQSFQGVDLVTLDLSFISVLMVMEAVLSVLKNPGGELVVLIKPQFEAKKGQVGKGGIIRDPAIHAEILDKVVRGIESHGFKCQGTTESPVKGATGNTEFLGYFCRFKADEMGVQVPDSL
eukprot:jgi/Mesvir1/20880/Mv07958-RA.1